MSKHCAIQQVDAEEGMAAVHRERAIGHGNVLAIEIGVVDADNGVISECRRVRDECRK